MKLYKVPFLFIHHDYILVASDDEESLNRFLDYEAPSIAIDMSNEADEVFIVKPEDVTRSTQIRIASGRGKNMYTASRSNRMRGKGRNHVTT